MSLVDLITFTWSYCITLLDLFTISQKKGGSAWYFNIFTNFFNFESLKK